MTAAETAQPWWKTAPNPPCEPWCQGGHEDGEFAFGGGFLCRLVVAETKWFTVEVSQHHSADEDQPGTVETLPAAVYTTFAGWHNEDQDPEVAVEAASQLAAAVLEAKLVVARAARRCPPWCVLGDDCRGDHWARVTGPAWPAVTPTADPRGQRPEVAFAPTWGEGDGLPPAVLLYIHGDGEDLSLDFRLEEARALCDLLARATRAVAETVAAS